MATALLVHRGKKEVVGEVSLADGDHRLVILVDNCENCGKIFNVDLDTDRFDSEKCRMAFHSKKRPRKTPRRRAS